MNLTDEIIKIFIQEMVCCDSIRFDFKEIKLGFLEKDPSSGENTGILMSMDSPSIVIGDNNGEVILPLNKEDVATKGCGCKIDGVNLIFYSYYRRNFGSLHKTFTDEAVKGIPYQNCQYFFRSSPIKMWTPDVTKEGLKLGNNIVVTTEHMSKIFSGNSQINALIGTN